MKIRISNRISATYASSVILWLSACQGELAVVDTLDSKSANLAAYRVDGPGLNASCACASSDSLTALSCGGGSVPLLENDVVQTTPDGGVVAFNLCDDEVETCHVVYWDGGFAELPSASGLLLGLSATGAHVLTTAVSSLELFAPSGTTSIPAAMIIGRGALSASGNTVVAAGTNGTSQLVRWTAGELEVLSEPPGNIITAYVTPDASAVVGYINDGEPYRWNEQGFTLGLTGAPTGGEIYPESLSTDGDVIAGRSTSDGAHFRWSEADGYVAVASASRRSGTSLSADGSVVLGSLDPEGANDTSAFRWTEASGAVEIAPGIATVATDLSDDGSVVVASSWEDAQLEGASPEQTFVWDAVNGTRSLEQVLAARGADTTGWEFGRARVLSGNGKVLLGRAECGGVPTLYRIVLAD